MISAEELPRRTIEVLGQTMAYTEVGDGPPIVFQHGNPTSSYLWRNIMPPLAGLGRCVAIDLIGMGNSSKLSGSGPGSYRFVEHRRYLDAALEALGITSDVTWVVHDWGSALGFDWANRHRSAVRGIAYMEAIVRPLSWDEFNPDATPVFKGFRSDAGEQMILDKNIFVERVLPGSVLRGLTEEEMAVYRRPFATPGESRRPTLTWPRQIPLDGEPADVVEIVRSYADWLSECDIPKLFIDADPGAILIGAQRDFCRAWPNQVIAKVKGSHFLQEDSPAEIAAELVAWVASLPLRST